MSFGFKFFNVNDSRTAMKVGTDAMLLGAWAHVPDGSGNIVDLGCGSGVLALMIAQRSSPGSFITGIEIDPGAAMDACENFAASPWSARLEVKCCDFASYNPGRNIDLIVSNPPYYNATLPNADLRRAVARHAEGLSPLAVLRFASDFLAEDGSVAMVTSPEGRRGIMTFAGACGLHLHRLCTVWQVQGKPKYRLLWQFGRQYAQPQITQFSVRGADGCYSDTYISLTKEYHNHDLQ